MGRISSVLSFDTSVPILFHFFFVPFLFSALCRSMAITRDVLAGTIACIVYVDSSCRVGARAADDSVARALHKTCARVCVP